MIVVGKVTGGVTDQAGGSVRAMRNLQMKLGAMDAGVTPCCFPPVFCASQNVKLHYSPGLHTCCNGENNMRSLLVVLKLVLRQ